MSIKIGSISLPNAIINAEWRIGVLEGVVDRIMQKNLSARLEQYEVDEIREKVFEALKQKYPDAGLKREP